MPFYPLVPKDTQKNILFRRKLLEWTIANAASRALLWNMCRRDFLFWLNTFGTIYEPRTPAKLPYITYECQDGAALGLLRCIGNKDASGDKSRDMGASWLVMAIFVWLWMFYEMMSLLVVSRKEDLVDARDDPDCLMWKMDFIIKNQPFWLRPNMGQFDRRHLHCRNPMTGSVIDGTATTGDVARGGRRTVMFIDEYAAFPLDDGYAILAATQAVSYSRFFASTPKGAAGAFYDIMHDPSMDFHKFRLHWSEHPIKRLGLYRGTMDRLDVLDRDYVFPSDYAFIFDGKLRSPWYDKECRRTPILTQIATELDIDYIGSANLAFDRETIRTAITRDARPSILQGHVDYLDDSAQPIGGFQETPGGRLELWRHVDALGKMSSDHGYVMGADIALGNKDAQGRGKTPSAAMLYDKVTGEKVGSLVVHGVDPKTFAKMVIAICQWAEGPDSTGAYLIWEANGPGRLFGDEVIRLSYPNIYYRRNVASVSQKESDTPGWWTTKDSKISLLSEYQRAISVAECVNRDEVALRECEQYVVSQTGGWEHIGSIASQDPTTARENHGDRAIADALAWHAIQWAPQEPEQEEVIPQRCFLRRREEAQRRGANKRKGW